MKNIKINRNSWHYKVAAFFYHFKNTYKEYYDELPPKKYYFDETNDLCSYGFYTLIYPIFIILSNVGFMLSGYTLIMYSSSIPSFFLAALYMIVILFVTLLFMFIILSGGSFISEIKIRKYIPDYSKYKNKFCPKVDYDE